MKDFFDLFLKQWHQVNQFSNQFLERGRYTLSLLQPVYYRRHRIYKRK